MYRAGEERPCYQSVKSDNGLRNGVAPVLIGVMPLP